MPRFQERMAQLSNAELMDIIRNRDDFQRVAFAAAEAELNSRNLDSHQFESAMDELDDIVALRAQRPKNPFLLAYEKTFESFRSIIYSLFGVK